MDIEVFEKAQRITAEIRILEAKREFISKDLDSALYKVSETAADKIKKIAIDDLDEQIIAAKAEFEAL